MMHGDACALRHLVEHGDVEERLVLASAAETSDVMSLLASLRRLQDV